MSSSLLKTSETFSQQIEHEFIQGSAIAPELYQAAIRIASDTEIHPGGEVNYPIHEALNWHLTRFGHQARETLEAALFLNEGGSVWQAKLSRSLEAGKKPYLAPSGNGSRAFLPAIPLSVWRKIAKRNKLPLEAVWESYAAQTGISLMEALEKSGAKSPISSDQTSNIKSSNDSPPQGENSSTAPAHSNQHCPSFKGLNLTIPSSNSLSKMPIPKRSKPSELERKALRCAIEALPGNTLVPNFWEFVDTHPEIPLTLTEGGKKAQCLLTLGYVAIALYGVNSGYRVKDATGNPIAPELIADVRRFCQPERHFTLAFDADEKRETRSKVSHALHKFGGLLKAEGCEVAIAQWKPEQGKGIDDLCVQTGADAVHGAIADALSLTHWQIWQRLENRLTWGASKRLNTKDLSIAVKPEDLPQNGILAIDSPKATGKTKLTATLVKGREKVLSATHRVALGRNLSTRLDLDWRGDLDKVNGQFVNGAAYTLRVSSCVDGILAIDPEKFRGCDLVIDEVVQVLRHLLTSSTTNQEGKRPALLARFRALIQVARRVIVADADLDNATLHCLRELRGDGQPVYLLRNSYQPTGYPVRFIKAKDRTVIVAELLKRAKELPAGKALMVASDSKQFSKSIARLLQNQSPDSPQLLINSETSGGEAEREFVQTPDEVLRRKYYRIIIASPSVATGLSAEEQGAIEAVYGIFTGGSSTDADMAQALSRVREPVERVVWCAERGSNFSKVSRETSPRRFKSHLQQRTSAVVSLVRSSLREDIAGTIDAYDWQSDPWVNLYCQIETGRNRSMFALRDSLLVRLRHEGNQVIVEDCNSDQTARRLLQQAREELKQIDATALLNAAKLTYAEVLALQQKENPSPDEQLAIVRYWLKDFYCLDSLTLEDVLWDNDGRRRGELLGLEALLYPGVAVDRTVKGLEKQASWNQGITPWDASGAELRRRCQAEIGLPELLEKMRAGWEWGAIDLHPYAEKARSLAPQIKAVLNLTIAKLTDVQIVHQLFSQLGLKFTKRQTRTAEKGKVTRLYQLDLIHWQRLEGFLQQRQNRREEIVTLPPVEITNQGGVTSGLTTQTFDKWDTPECLAEIRALWAIADNPEAQAAVRQICPPDVFERAIALASPK